MKVLDEADDYARQKGETVESAIVTNIPPSGNWFLQRWGHYRGRHKGSCGTGNS